MDKNDYLCIEMSGKGSISRMSDECLMKQETVFLFYIDCQAVMRKFTLAGKSIVCTDCHHSWIEVFAAKLNSLSNFSQMVKVAIYAFTITLHFIIQ